MDERTPAPNADRLAAWRVEPPGIPRPRLSIILPAKDEAERLPKTVREILAHPWQDISYEVWVVDDGSRDATAAVVRDWQGDYPQLGLISYQPNRGKGHALKQGILQARGEVILLADADGATPIEEIWRLWPHLSASHRIVIGSRVLSSRETAVKTRWHRKLIGWIFVRLVQWLVIEGIYDTQCGFKLLEAKAAQDIARHLTLDGFGVDVELLMIAKRRQYGIREVPINWVNQPGSKVHLLRDGFKMLLEILAIRRKASQGLYERALPQNREQVPQ
ncbi:MAG: glycosyltransferase family 2 protein [Thermostichales cyanobacterium SZTDM-1c_bins_54]